MSMLDRLASKLYGGNRLEVSASLASVSTDTYTAIATSDSADGSVSIVISDDVTQPDEWQDGDLTEADLGTSIEVPTTVAVKAGDRVLVTASGAETINTMVVTGVVGRGDEQQGQIDAATIAADDAFDAAANAEALAQQAEEVAQATGQYFWHNTGEETDPIEADVSGGTGAHVTQFKREEWSDPTHENYHKGPNSLWNSMGMLFRNGLNNLMALLPSPDQFTPSRIAFYDGNGNADSNIIASIMATAAEFARQFDWAQASTGDVEFFGGLAGVHVESTPFTPEGGTAPTVVDMVTRVDGTLDLRDEGYGYASGELRAQQEVSQIGGSQAMASIEAASSKGTGNGYASLGVQSSSTGSSAIDAAADTIVFQGSNGAIIDTATMLETVNSIRTASKTLNLTTTNIGSGTKTVYLERQGHIVTAYYGGTLTPTAANTLYTVGTIPSGYRPKRGCFANCNGIVNNTIVGRTARWRFLNTGAVQVICSGTGITEYPFGVSWFTDDDWPA